MFKIIKISIVFLSFLRILDFDDDFELVTLWPIIWPEVFQNVIFYQKTFLQALKTILHTLDDSL